MNHHKVKQKNIVMRIPTAERHCAVCFEEFGEPIIASHFCQECTIDLCKPCKLRHQKKHANHNLCEVVIDQVSTCSKHTEQTLDSYCRSCNQLICAYCALESTHRDHACFLWKDIEHEEREFFANKWNSLKQEIEKWLKNIKVERKDFENELVLIENKRVELHNQVCGAFDMLRNSLQKRQEHVIQEIDQVCQTRSQLIKTILEITHQEAFNNSTQLSLYELPEKKLALKTLDGDFKKIQSEFICKLDQIHNIELVDMEDPFLKTESTFNNLASIYTEPMDQQPRQFLFDCNQIEATQIDGQSILFKRVGKTGSYNSIYQDIELSHGIYKWSITPKTICTWIASGVAVKSLATNKNYSATYNQDKWIFTHHGYRVSSSEANIPLSFGVGEEVVFEMNCNTRILKATVLRKGISSQIENIILPVYPVLMTYGEGEALFKVLQTRLIK